VEYTAGIYFCSPFVLYKRLGIIEGFAMKDAPKAGKIAPRKRMAMGEFGEKFGCASYDSVHGGKAVSPATKGKAKKA
jgi:hypothetical protein